MRPEIIEFEKGMPVKAFIRSVEKYPYHWHDTLEIIQVLKGSLTIDVGDHNLTLNENDIIIVNIGELHCINKTHEDNEVLFLQIDERFCRSVLPDNKYLFFYCCSAYHEAQIPEKYRILKECIARLVCAITKKPDREYKKNISNILSAMLSYISYNFDFLRWGYGTTPFSDKLVKRLKQIAEHAGSDLDVRLRLKELAAEAGVSLAHLSTIIKDKFGYTFCELLYYGRCANAAKLLLSTNRRVIEIAMDCGFSDVKYFVKYFKYYFHCLPSEFRKMHQADIQAIFTDMRMEACLRRTKLEASC